MPTPHICVLAEVGAKDPQREPTPADALGVEALRLGLRADTLDLAIVSECA